MSNVKSHTHKQVFSKVSASAYERVSAYGNVFTDFDWEVKRGIENSVRNQSCPLTRMSVSGEF